MNVEPHRRHAAMNSDDITTGMSQPAETPGGTLAVAASRRVVDSVAFGGSIGSSLAHARVVMGFGWNIRAALANGLYAHEPGTQDWTHDMIERGWKSRLRRAVVGILAAWLGLVVWGWWFAWRRLPTLSADESITLAVPIMDGAGYAAVINTHPRPKIVRIDGAERGALLLYGAEHVRDPAHPQIGDIAARWAEFRPTIALCESRLGVLFPGLMDPVTTFGEPGAVHALARRDDVPTYTWEPPIDSYMRCLLAQPFSKEQVALRVILGSYFSNRRHGRPKDPEAYVLDTLGERSRWPGIEGVLSTIDEVNAAWKRHFPEGPDWREVSDQYGLPGFLRDLDINVCRQEHLARLLIRLAGRGERVFAVAGSSHAVRIGATVKATLESIRHEHRPE